MFRTYVNTNYVSDIESEFAKGILLQFVQLDVCMTKRLCYYTSQIFCILYILYLYKSSKQTSYYFINYPFPYSY